MTYTVLPFTNESPQVHRLTIAPDGFSLQARFELRYLPSIDRWILSIYDDTTGELLVNNIPLQTSRVRLDDLLYPFRHLRQGKGLGSMFCLTSVEHPATENPSENNLTEFQVLIGDTYDE